MKRLSDLEYLKLNKFQAFLYNFKLFLCAIPIFFKNIGLAIVRFFKNAFLGIAGEFAEIGRTFKNGNWAFNV